MMRYYFHPLMMLGTVIRNVPELLDATVGLHQDSRHALSRYQARLGTMTEVSPIPSLICSMDVSMAEIRR